MEDGMKQKVFGQKWKFLVGAILLITGVTLVVACNKGNSPQEVSSTTPTTTSAAPDPNGEGVRPDVRAYIETTYSDSAKTRAALFQYAKVTELALADSANKQLSIQHANESNRANTCLWYVREATNDAIRVGDDLLSIVLNTDARNKAYLAYDKQLGGEVFMDIPYDQRASACDINPSTLPN